MTEYNTKGYGKIGIALIILVCLALTGIISYSHHLAGHELEFTLFYLFPIILSAWKGGIWAGIFISFAGASLWLITDLLVIDKFSNNIIPFFNATFRLMGFLITTYIASELKSALVKHRNLASTDPLTSLLNKRAFYELSAAEINRARRYGYTISILSIDLDNFKTVNDTLGHHTGDILLKTVAKILNNNVRNVDLAGRLGGDEFGILLSNSSAESAFTVANKLRNILLDGMKKNGWPVTFSIGLATFQHAPENVEEMIKKGDILMYTAKKNGKNMIKSLIVS